MVFTNMFAIFYLEVICMTKKTAKKTDDDKNLGHYINIFITLFYVILFGSMILLSYGFYNDTSVTLTTDGTVGIGKRSFTNFAGTANETALI